MKGIETFEDLRDVFKIYEKAKSLGDLEKMLKEKYVEYVFLSQLVDDYNNRNANKKLHQKQ